MQANGTGGIQSRIARWVEETLGEEMQEADLSPLQNRAERAVRFVEEAIELAQSIGVEREQLHRLVDYVMSRPVGDTSQEVGGAMLTLYAVAASCGVDADERVLKEIERVETPEIRAKVRHRQREKREALVTEDAPQGGFVRVHRDDLRSVLDRNARLQDQVVELQKRGTELVEEARAARRAQA